MSKEGVYKQTYWQLANAKDPSAGTLNDATFTVTFRPPPATLEPGKRVPMPVSSSATGSVHLGKVGVEFYYQARTPVFQQDNTSSSSKAQLLLESPHLLVQWDANTGLKNVSGPVTPFFLVPPPASGDTFWIKAIGYNSSSITWTYTFKADTAPTQKLPTQMSQSAKRDYNKDSAIGYKFGAIFGLVAGVFGAFAGPLYGLPFLVLAYIATNSGADAQGMAADPPDPHFKAIARPTVGRWPRVSASGKVSAATAAALNALSQNGAHLLALHRAELTAVERSQGAAAAGSAAWTKKQSLAAADYADQLAAAYRRQVALLERLPLPPKTFGAKLTAAQVRSFQRDVAAHGLPAKLTTTLRRFGLRAPDLAPLRTAIARLEPAAATRSLPTIVHDRALTRTFNASADAFKQYAKAIRVALGIHA